MNQSTKMSIFCRKGGVYELLGCMNYQKVYGYYNLPKIHPWALNCGSSKREMGLFLRVVIILSKIRPSNTQLVYLYLCTHGVILQCFFCYALAYAITANDLCLHLLVPPHSKYCFFSASYSACTIAQIGGRTIERKAAFATTLLKKGGGLILQKQVFLLEMAVLCKNNLCQNATNEVKSCNYLSRTLSKFGTPFFKLLSI